MPGLRWPIVHEFSIENGRARVEVPGIEQLEVLHLTWGGDAEA